MTKLRFYWLGAPRIKRGNDVLQMETQKATALLAILNHSIETRSRENLAALFWSEFNQDRAHANLRRTLFTINQTLGSDILKINRRDIGINPNALIWQDTDEFCLLVANTKAHAHPEIACPECIASLEKAVSLYQGDFLEGINLKDCPEFDDWQYLQRENFRSELAFVLHSLAQTYLVKREWDKAILRSRQWVNLDPFHEPAQRMLIQAYGSSGRRSAALHQFEECSSRLQDELGQSPNEETIALYQNIQSGKLGELLETTTFRPLVDAAKQPLIKSKLFIPRPRTGLVTRQPLLRKLEQGTQSSLILISAPAGYGKTTLLSEWINTLQKAEASSPWTICWFSLEPGDNDPIRFLTYLTAALEQANPGVGAETRSLIGASESLNPTTPLSVLLNDLQELTQSVLLVLDDYQFISNPVIHDGITFLLEHLPDNVRVVIATRSDPPIALARLRGRNQLTEIRAHDLRFTSFETHELLNQVFNLALTPEQIAMLENRTEGWIAGLQLAAISMRGRLDIAQFIEAFSGSQTFIMDYLAEEALNRQSIEIQEFLLQTSILERLSEALCDYVLTGVSENKNDDSQSSAHHLVIRREIQSQLTQLEHLNLFIVPLDDERVWYRYHHLFADLLRTRLQNTSPELIPILHSRAAAWFEKNGWIDESINHFMAAEDWKNASRLIAKHIPAHLENGQMTTIMEWFQGLPQDIIYRNPKLCVLVAETYAHAGMMDQVDPFLNQAEAFQVVDLSTKDRTAVQSMVGILRGFKLVCSGQSNRALDSLEKALSETPEMGSRELALLHWIEGWAYRSLGRLDHAVDHLTIATEFEREAGAILRDIWTDLAITNRSVGKLHQAIDIFTNSLQIAADRGIQNQGNLSRDEAYLSLLFLEQNQLDLAWTHANRAIAYTQWWPSQTVIAIAYACLAQILMVRGDFDDSIAAVQKADLERKNRLMTPFVHSLVDVTLTQIWLILDEWARLDQWSSDQVSAFNAKLSTGDLIDEYLEMRLIMLVRIWMKKTKIDKNRERDKDCLQLLTQLEDNSRSAGRVNSLVEILVLKESIRFSEGKTYEALRGLDNCLSLAELGGYMRIFLNTGEPARALLSTYLQRSYPMHKLYAMKILKAFGGLPSAQNPLEGSTELTSREIEVLRFLGEGCSNRQIAARLVLSEGTIKFHVHQILEKLQVKSRTQAIARARDLELI